MTRTVYVLSGPNLSALGTREPEIYGSQTLADLHDDILAYGHSLDLTCDLRQSDDEGQIIAWLQEAAEQGYDVVLNPAAFTHYSYALADACTHLQHTGRALIEVHLSNPAGREAFRRHSVISPAATGTIAGFGAHSYLLALQALVAER